MKREAILCCIFVIIFFSAQATAVATREEKINKAFACLDSQIERTEITLEQAVFAALTDSNSTKINATINLKKHPSENCWPNTGCTIKDTAQVLLAKNRMGEKTKEIEKWLIERAGVSDDLIWYLQITIDNNEEASCEIRYDDQEIGYNIVIDRELKIREERAGNCLTRTQSGYWLRISNTNECLTKTFAIKCNKKFKTNLLYQLSGSNIIYVSSDTNTGDANSFTKEKLKTLCFKAGGRCDYEGSLWASIALYLAQTDLDQDTISDYEKFIPFLRSLADNNRQFFPEAFLVKLFGIGNNDEYYSALIQKWRPDPKGGYWQVGQRGRYYDSALALIALGGENAPEREVSETIKYLFAKQEQNGCWNSGSIVDTAFIIYGAGWLRQQREDLPPSESVCGNNIVEYGEDCDGTNLSGESCDSQGRGAGNLSCYPKEHQNQCRFDFTGCSGSPSQPVCGNNIVEYGEDCDGTNLSGKTCSNLGFGGGTLSCYPKNHQNQCLFDFTGCSGSPSQPVCGNNIVEYGEDCDGANLSGKTCNLLGLGGGTLKCYPRDHQNQSFRCRFDTRGCQNGSETPPFFLFGRVCSEVGGVCKQNCGINETSVEAICFQNKKCCAPSSNIIDELTTCVAAGYYCVPDQFSCISNGGNILPADLYPCQNWGHICCSANVRLFTCAQLGGEICDPTEERCSQRTTQASDGACCLDECIERKSREEDDDECETNDDCPSGKVCSSGGKCVTRSALQCANNEDCNSDEKCENGQCVPKERSFVWIWIVVFLVLIVLVVLGIIYRDKLRLMLYKGKKTKEAPSRLTPFGPAGQPLGMVVRRPPPRFGPGQVGMPAPGFIRQNQMPPPIRRIPPRPPTEKEKEMEETLKKLKEMSK